VQPCETSSESGNRDGAQCARLQHKAGDGDHRRVRRTFDLFLGQIGSGQQYAAPDETRLLAGTYPTGMRAWIERSGGLTRKTILLRGRQLSALYGRCQ